jgi:hypothetical protein
MIAKLPDGSYPFINEHLPLSEMTMVEAPRELEKLFISQAGVNGVEILRDAPVELRCRSEEYPDATFLIYRPHGSDRIHMLVPTKFARRQGLTADEFGFAGRTSGVAAQTRPLKQAGQGFSIDGFAFPNGHDFPTQSRQFRSRLSVSFDVAIEFALPEFGTRLRCGRLLATGVAMPKASVNEKNYFPLRKDEIGSARQISSLKSKAQSDRVRALSHA